MFGRRRFLWGALVVVAITVLSPMVSAHTVSPSSAAPLAPLAGHSAPIGVSVPTAHSSTGSSVIPASRLATEQRILNEIKTSGAPSKYAYLPNFASTSQRVGNVITPGNSHSPAPVGVAAYGVINTTGIASAQVLNTPSYEGQLTVNNADIFYLDDDSTDYFGTQLNTVMYNTTLFGNSSYQFWTQNVISYSARSNLLQFVDNIWNFSSPAVFLSSNVFLNHSANGTQVGNAYYYGLGPVINITMPFTLDLYNNASLTDVSVLNATNVSVTLPFDKLWYNYSVWKSGHYVQGGSYDWAIFNSQNVSNPTLTPPAPQFQVNGAALTGTGFIPDDAELVLCGPGGGSTSSVNALNATVNLWWWNSVARAYQNIPSAFNLGSETGETIQGVASWYDSQHNVHLGAGPTLASPMWNMSPSARPGFVTITGTVTPANAFVFVNTTTNFSTPLNPYWDAWVPVPANGQLNVQVPPANYSGEILMSNFDPATFVLNLSNASTWNVNGSLTFDPFQGIYTPLIAYGNAELPAISSSGDGSAGNPYQIWNNEYGALAPEFSTFNDYVFPDWPGILIAHTTAHIDINAAAPFAVNYQDVLAKAVASLGFPSTNYLGIQLYGTQYVSIVGAPLITGWFSQFQQGYPLGNIMAWNTSHTLIAENFFNSMGTSIMMFGGTGNLVASNWFTQTPTPGVENGFAPEGIWLAESGDTVYNNAFDTSIGAYSPMSSPYGETFYSSLSASWTDAWNVSKAPATWVNTVNGYALSGSIVGGTWVGGNYWVGFNGTVPWNDFGAIAIGGDYLPLESPAGAPGSTLSFQESGLAAGTAWSLTLDGILWSSTTPWINFTLANGSYTYQVTPVAGFVASPSSGTATVAGSTTSVAIKFTAPPSGPWNVVFIETGLPAGTTWTITLGGVTVASALQEIYFSEGNGSYSYTVTPPSGYNASVLSGSVTVKGGNPAAVDITMAALLGWIAGVVTPTGSQVWIDGAEISVNSVSGAFNVSATAGMHAIEVTDSGHHPAFDNITVAPRHTTSVSFALQSSSSSTTAGTLFSGSGGVVVAILATLVVIFFIATLYFASTRRAPMMMKPEAPADGSRKP